jgi:hypothetical protein
MMGLVAGYVATVAVLVLVALGFSFAAPSSTHVADLQAMAEQTK